MKYIKNAILACIIHNELKNLQPGIKLERMVKIIEEIKKNSSQTYFPENFNLLFQESKSPRDTSYRSLVMLKAMKILHRIDEKKAIYRITNLGKYICKNNSIIEDLKIILESLYSIKVLIEFIKDTYEVSKKDIEAILGKEMNYYSYKFLEKATPKPYSAVIGGELLNLLTEFKILHKNSNTKKYYY